MSNLILDLPRDIFADVLAFIHEVSHLAVLPRICTTTRAMCSQVEEGWLAFLLKRCTVFEHDQRYKKAGSVTADAGSEWNGTTFKVYLSMKVLKMGRSAMPHVVSLEVVGGLLFGTRFGTRRIVQKRTRMIGGVETVVLKPATKCRGAVLLRASDVP